MNILGTYDINEYHLTAKEKLPGSKTIYKCVNNDGAEYILHIDEAKTTELVQNYFSEKRLIVTLKIIF